MISCVKFLKEKEIERKRCQWQPSFLSSPDITLPRMVCSFTIMHPIIKAIISANDLSAGTFSHEPTETRRPYLRYCVAAAIYELARRWWGCTSSLAGLPMWLGSPEESAAGGFCRIKLTPLPRAGVPCAGWRRMQGAARGRRCCSAASGDF